MKKLELPLKTKISEVVCKVPCNYYTFWIMIEFVLTEIIGRINLMHSIHNGVRRSRTVRDEKLKELSWTTMKENLSGPVVVRR